MRKIITLSVIYIVIISVLIMLWMYKDPIQYNVSSYVEEFNQSMNEDNSGKLSHVFDQSRETETFGEYKYNDFKGKHYGIDYDIPKKTPVKAASDGEVTRTFNDEYGGKVVQISEDNGRYYQWYMHLNEIKVKEGQRVEAGEVIALSGNTGKKTSGPHLHFQRMKDGLGNDYAENPHSFIDKLPDGEKSLYKLKK
ncbi:M23 family metallopeptidase [Staphylococcus sp. Marseille-Q5304]|uniref:M23 family metallopeptidase n=1 Tax=Staphylococcus sp. Marseille-Q5304 TaxID=2942200 RepID=UPI002072DB5A|nr:M23 family metallopeptidase [Staphylococcus sp. Marseille-Q5304]